MTITDRSYFELRPCQTLRGVGPSLTEKLARIGIDSVQALLFHLPLRYQDRTHVLPIREILPGEYVVIEGQIEALSEPKIGKTRLLCRLRDPTGCINLRFFHVNAIHRRHLFLNASLRCYGEVRLSSSGLEMMHPEFQLISNELPLPVPECLTPIYQATEGLSQTTFRKLTDEALRLLEQDNFLQDILPSDILSFLSFPHIKQALRYVHRPPPDAPTDLLTQGKHAAQQRLVFEELLAHRLSLLQLKQSFQVHQAYFLKRAVDLKKKFLQNLSFDLTGAQERVVSQIEQDLSRSYPMLRLVQGDVGSGKTVVAALAMLQAIENGYQVVMLAPTELLAEQHYTTFKKWFDPLSISVAFLSGQLKQSIKKDTWQAIASGQISVVIGTHALFQKNVFFPKLALIIVDEQHRFGVEQRASLRAKGMYQNHYPHQMIMTATPIPRTLAMSFYADLDCSVIDELPPGRVPVTTSVLSNEKRQDLIKQVKEMCASGKQIYWVCTLIEESEVLQCKTAEETAAELALFLPQNKVGLIHGRMKSTEKEAVMISFRNGEISLLVATTVIEVGVDVPNASVMIIENAERLGLAQLHQLRGRVGRGAIASYCVLLYQSPLSLFAKERLNIMRETNDGFKIAERDLEMRGPGEVLGTKQTGDINLRIANLIRDASLLPFVQEASVIIEQKYPEIIPLLIHRWLGNKHTFGHV